MTHDPATIVPGRYSPSAARLFRIVARRMISKRFHAFRATPGSMVLIARHNNHAGPVICCLSHSSWWDPMVGFLLHARCLPARTGCAPIDRAVLENLRFFRRLGLFGIDPDDPASQRAMLGYVTARFEQEARPTLWITPQGRFQDPRSEMTIRPGVAAIAARSTGVRAIAIVLEYPFWDDQKPELLLHARAVPAPARPDSTASWQRSIVASMRSAAADLAERSIARDPAAFETVLRKGSGGTHPVYDLALRLTGRATSSIRTRHADAAP